MRNQQPKYYYGNPHTGKEQYASKYFRTISRDGLVMKIWYISSWHKVGTGGQCIILNEDRFTANELISIYERTQEGTEHTDLQHADKMKLVQKK